MQALDTSRFHPISLDQMDAVKLMDRTDTKFCATREQVQQLFDLIQNEYYILTITGENKLAYATTYYDTPEAEMYIDHARGKMNRYKVRRRTYLASNIHFLEVKFKNNKGRTIKERIATHALFENLNAAEIAFLENHIPFDPEVLKPGLKNLFTRITLVNKNFSERCTIDIDLKFGTDDETASVNDLVIIELKSGGRNTQSPLLNAIRDIRLRPTGFSKYCMGRTLVDNSLKSNSIKPKIRALRKLSHIKYITHQPILR